MAIEVSSVPDLCRYLIFCAVQRCRISDELCRLSVVLKSCPEVHPPLVRISVSDTGSGSNPEEFQILRCSTNPIFASKWDGVISAKTTSISENEISNFRINLKETESSRRLSKLPSMMKQGAKFSGTEASLTTTDGIDDLLLHITLFLQKMCILKTPKIAVELLVDNHMVPGSQGNCIIAVDCSTFPSSAANIEHMKSGLEEYVLKHGNRLHDICNSCFSTKEHLKVGTGWASRSATSRSNVQMMEAVVVISETPEKSIPSCYSARGSMTEVFFFKDFTPCLITQSTLDALASIKWKDYGLSLKSIADQEGSVFLEWDGLPPYVHIDLALHSYSEQAVIVPCAGKSQVDRTLTRKAVNDALSELKEKNDGALLSAHALKIQDYAPELAKTIAGLILSSNDLNFRQECFSLLALQFQNSEGNTIEDCIKERMISAISKNDRKPKRNREPKPLLFEDCFFQLDFLDREHEEGEEVLSALAL